VKPATTDRTSMVGAAQRAGRRCATPAPHAFSRLRELGDAAPARAAEGSEGHRC